MIQKINLYFGIFMALLIFTMGIGLWSSDILLEAIPVPNRNYLAIVFVIYSLFRFYRVYLLLKRKDED